MGVCCIVFDIDGMLFEFCMNFLNIEKNNFVFSIFQVFFAFHAISNINKKNWCKKKFRGGVWIFFFFRKTIQFFLISRLCYFQQKNIEKCPFTYWLNGRWFLQIVERDSWNIYPLYPLFPCSDFVPQMWGWFGGRGACNVFLTFYAIFNISKKKIWEYKTIISHLPQCFLRVFFVCWKYCNVPLHLQLLVKWEVVSPNSRYRAFYHEIGNIEKCPFTYW